mmetsp:Transcript_19322/g.45199  ORF Transcript_19322/g.45199 Transcript_19322/m.45199 type:complete len:215 (-) Transcript_19322:1213-1857(-)
MNRPLLPLSPRLDRRLCRSRLLHRRTSTSPLRNRSTSSHRSPTLSSPSTLRANASTSLAAASPPQEGARAARPGAPPGHPGDCFPQMLPQSGPSAARPTRAPPAVAATALPQLRTAARAQLRRRLARPALRARQSTRRRRQPCPVLAPPGTRRPPAARATTNSVRGVVARTGRTESLHSRRRREERELRLARRLPWPNAIFTDPMELPRTTTWP